MEGQRYKASKPAKAPSPNLGGWRGAAGSLAALSAHRFNIRDARRCAKCNQPALDTSRFCIRHAGRGAAGRGGPCRQARREVQRLLARGAIAPGLLELDVFCRATFARLEFAPVALSLVRAWDNRDNDPAAWVSAVRAARDKLSA